MYKLLSLIGCVLLWSNNIQAQNCTFSLSGHVVDADVKEQLSNASVTLKEINTTILTDAKGDFIFQGLCAGSYTILVQHLNCKDYTESIDLKKSIHLDINLPHAVNTLGEAVVVAQKEKQSTGFKKEISGAELMSKNGSSLAQALGNINGVTLLQTGSNVAKPVVHGLSGSRLLIINNGVRLEGQQWGNEHAPEVDPFIADKLEVIKGVDELKYGSDAIGGVILIEPKALGSTPGKSLQFNTGYFSNNKQYYFSGILEQQLKKIPSFTYRAQATYKRGANSTTPNYRLNNTGNEELNFSLALGIRKTKWNSELFYSFFSTKLGIFTGSHIGNLTDLYNAIAAKQPDSGFIGQNTYSIGRPRQEVKHQTIKSKTVFTIGKQKFSALVSGQFNLRKEFDIVRTASNVKPQIMLNINTLAEDLQWEHPKTKNLKGTIGLSAVQQQNTYSGRYFIPNYISYTTGIYAIEKWTKHFWELQTGFRMDVKKINTSRLRINNNFSAYTFNFNTYAASFNAIYKPTGFYKTNFNIALSTRAPYVNELLSDGIHHGTATYEKGNIYLKPEKSVYLSWNHEVRTTNDRLRFSLLLYHNPIQNFIYQVPKPESPVLTIAGAFPQIQYTQTNATLSGTDLAAEYKLSNAFDYKVKLALLYGRNTSAKDWLILMPANRLEQELLFKLPDGKKTKETGLSFKWTQVARQNRVPSANNIKQDYKNAPAGYALFQVGMNSTLQFLNLPVTVFFGVENIANTVYRDYLNAFRYFSDETGRNFTLRIHLPINF